LGIAGTVDLDRLAFPQDGAAVRRVDPGDDLDEGGFSGPVVAQQRDDFARVDGQVDVAERLDRAESLGNPGQLQDRLCHNVSSW